MGKWQHLELPGNSPPELMNQIGDFLARHPGTSIEHDMRWLRCQSDTDEPAAGAFYIAEGGKVIGYAPYRSELGRLSFEIAYKSLFSRKTQRLVFTGAPLIEPALGRDRQRELTRSFITELHRMLTALTRNSVVFIMGLRDDSDLAQLLVTKQHTSSGFFVIPRGPSFARRGIAFSGGYDDYLAGQRKKTRYDLRTTKRRFSTYVEDDWAVTKYSTAEKIDDFLDAAILISKKTYQWKLLGIGLRDRAALASCYAQYARYGWFASYILRARGHPIAFHIGFNYGATHYMYEIGHDPAWNAHNVGVFLFNEVVRDLSAPGSATKHADFLYGDSVFKARLGNTAHQERHYYIIPKDARGVLNAWPLWATNIVTGGINFFLERLGLKQTVQRFLRGRS